MDMIRGEYRLGGLLVPRGAVQAPELRLPLTKNIPRRVDLRPQCSPVENQGQVGSCAANAMVGALEYHQIIAGDPLTDLSRLFVYYNSRQLGGTDKEDSGTMIHHVMAAVMAHGACPENMWPYVKAMWPTKPPQQCYDNALNFTAVEYAQVQGDETSIFTVLANGLPVVFGIWLPGLVYEAAFNDGRLPPEFDYMSQAPGGGHAMLIVGYDLDAKIWICRNSWGQEFGDNGHFYLPFALMDKFATQQLRAWGVTSQFWTIGAISKRQGFSLQGASQGASLRATQEQAPAQMQDALARFKQQVAGELEDRLASARQGFRDRLRGPGAGGGY